MWQQQLKRAEDLGQIRDFGTRCQGELAQPTPAIEFAAKILQRTEDLGLARDSAFTIATEVIDRVQELRFFGDRSVKTPGDLDALWSEWWPSSSTQAPVTQETYDPEAIYRLCERTEEIFVGSFPQVCNEYFKRRHNWNDELKIYQGGRVVTQGIHFMNATREEITRINEAFRNWNAKKHP